MSNFETNGIKLENGNLGCPGCGREKFNLIAHLDGTNSFENRYECDNCHSVVWTRQKRSKEDQAWWGDDDETDL